MGQRQSVTVELIELKSEIQEQLDGNQFCLYFIIEGKVVSQSVRGEREHVNGDTILVNRYQAMTLQSQVKKSYLLKLLFSFSAIEKMIGRDWRPSLSEEKLALLSEEDYLKYTEKLFRLVLDDVELFEIEQSFSHTVSLLQFMEYLERFVVEDMVESPLLDDNEAYHPNIQMILSFVEENYNTRLSLKELATEHYVSEAYLSRLFKEETGVTFSDYVSQLRLSYAVKELRQSEAPILTIALNNGFPNSKRFTEVFKQKYDVTPHVYRQSDRPVVENNRTSSRKDNDYRVLSPVEAIQVIAQYMLNENIRKTSDSIVETHNIDVSQGATSLLNKPQKIINIGQAEHGLSEDVRQQIRLVQEKIPFDFIRFYGLCEEVDKQHFVIVDKHVNNHRLFSFINDMRLRPMIVLTVKKGQTLRSWQATLIHLRKVIQGYVHFEASFREGWYLEIETETGVPHELYVSCYLEAKRFLEKSFTTNRIGMSLSNMVVSEFKQTYLSLLEDGKEPDFICLTGEDSEQSQVTNHLRHHETFGERLDSWSQWWPETVKRPELFVTEWNMIASEGNVLSGTFFRAGIVMKALVELSKRVDAVGFWLNLESESVKIGEGNDSNLSLFLHGPLKRPLFFVLTLFERVGDKIVYEDDRFLVTQRFNSYYLLYYHYYYLNPEDTAYENLWKTSQKQGIFSFEGLPKGTYLIKRFLLDSHHGGIYNQWLKAGGMMEMDTDIQEYLLQSVVPDFQIKESKIEDGELEEQVQLEMNACYLVIMNRLSSDPS